MKLEDLLVLELKEAESVHQEHIMAICSKYRNSGSKIPWRITIDESGLLRIYDPSGADASWAGDGTYLENIT